MRRIAVIATVFALAACADLSVLDACQQFAQLEETRGQINDLDPATATADDARQLSEDILDELQDFETAADGLYSQQIENYRLAIQDVQQLMVDVEGGAAFTEWAPVLGESLTEARRAFVQLETVVGPACES